MMCWKSKVIIIFLSLMTAHTAYSQEVRQPELSVGHELCVVIASKFKVPQLTPPPPKPSNWKRGALIDLGMTQTSFTNWAAGGNPSVAMNGAVNMYANYTVKTLFWRAACSLHTGLYNNLVRRIKRVTINLFLIQNSDTRHGEINSISQPFLISNHNW